MRYQARPWSCGPAALVNAFRAIGLKYSESRLRSIAGSSQEHGTDEKQLIMTIRMIGMSVVEHSGSDKNAAWAFIRSSIMDGRPCLICIDRWQHWVSIIGMIGNRVIVCDSSNSARNISENGIRSLSRSQLLKSWACPGEDLPFYGMSIGKN